MTERDGRLPEFETIRLERDGLVLKATIAHPASPLNAVDDALHHDLADLFGFLRDVREVRAVLLTAEGRAFSAGGNYEWFPTLRSTERLEEARRVGRRIVVDLLDVELPIVAAVNGPAIGLGATIALLCDVIFMADTAVIADPHVSVGLVAGDGGAVIWPLVLGPARAKEHLLTGDPVDAHTAERYGLVNRCVAPDDLEREALAFARRLAHGPPLAIKFTKLAVNKLVKDAFNTAFDASLGLELVTFLSEDHVEAVDALKERRQPTFHER